MISCPIPGTLDPLIQYAESVGLNHLAKQEALRAYMMLNSNLKAGEEPKIPSPAEFNQMMEIAGVFVNSPDRKPVDTTNDLSTFSQYQELIGVTPMTAQSEEELKVSVTLGTFANKLSTNLNVPYEFITKEKAIELTAGINKWSGQPAFFLGNTVYIIPELANEKTVFHEFAHPVIRAIKLSNPELYSKLTSELSTLPEAAEIMEKAKEAYPGIDENDPIIMEEALVISLTKAADEKNSSAFNTFIKNLLFNIKQLLRKLFGKDNKISIEKLKADTTLAELADLLVIQPLDIDVDTITREDLAAYATDTQNIVKAMNDFSQESIIEGVNDLYSKVDTWLAVLEKNKDYEHMKEIVKDFYQKSDINEIKKNLAPYQTLDSFIDEEISKLRDDVAFANTRTEAFATNLLRMKALAQRINKAVGEYVKDINNPENIGKVFYINNILKSWKEFLDNLTEITTSELSSGNIDATNPVIDLLGNIQLQIDAIEAQTAKIYTGGSSQMIKKSLTPLMTSVDNKYQAIRANWIKNGASQIVLDRLDKDYWGISGLELSNFLKYKAVVDSGGKLTTKEQQVFEILKKKSFVEGSYLTPEKIDYLMSGQLGDAGGVNSFMESFIYNQDLIVSGFALWVKNQMTDVYTTSQVNANAFLSEMRPLMEAAGYNQADTSEFGARVVFNNKKGSTDKDGNFITKEVPTFLMPYKDWQLVTHQMNYDIEVAIKNGNTEEILKLKREREQFMTDFFTRPYTDEYYKRFDVLNRGENDIIGKKAKSLRDEIMSRIRNLSSSMSNMTRIEANDAKPDLDVLWQEYRQLYSNYTDRGQLKDEEGVAIAERLREYREASKDIYDSVLVANRFENSLAAYENELITEKKYLRGSQAFRKLRNNWIANNTRVKLKDTFYSRQSDLIEELKSITNKITGNDAIKETVADLEKKLGMLIRPYKDEDNQPEATAMSQDILDEIKQTELEIDKAYAQLDKANGLTILESIRLSELFDLAKLAEGLSDEEYNERSELLSKKSKNGLSKEDKKRLGEIRAELKEIKQSIPTVHYIDVINNYVNFMDDTTPLQDLLLTTDINETNADAVLTQEFYEKVASVNPVFKKWYEDNHIITLKKDSTGQVSYDIRRTRAWSVVRPRSSAYYELHSFINSNGKEEVINRIPNMTFYDIEVKDKYVTKQVSMLEAIEQGDPTLATMDNKGKPLPKMDAPDNRFINDKFFKVRDTDKKLFDALLGLTKWHLRFQEDNPSSSKLFMEVPRFRKHGYEITRESLRAGENPISRWWKNFWRFIRGSVGNSKDPYDQGLNFEDQVMAMEGELFIEDEGNGIPIHGLADLAANEVSLDITFGMLKYMVSSEKQKALIKMNPMARALQSVVNDPETTEKILKTTAKRTMRTRNPLNFAAEKTKLGKRKTESIRAKAINNFIEREFEGKNQKGILGGTAGTQWVSKVTTQLMKMSAFGYFALDIGSALKNSMNARLQSIIEAAGGRYYNQRNYARGVIWSNKVSAEMSFNLYKFAPKSKDEQLMQIFDAYQGRLEEKLPEMGSRSLTKDALGGLSWMTSFRKWTEINSTLSTFGAMLYHTTIPRTVNGKTEYIAYMDAWEMGPDNQIKLVDGVDPEWGMGGEKFKEFKNKVQGVINNLNGAFGKFDYAEADKYLAWRWVINLKRWFMRMFLNRYQFRGSILNPKYRYDAAINDTVMGYHIEALRYTFRGIGSLGKTLPFMTPSEKVAVIKTLMDGALLIALSLLVSSVFGFDDDDEERYAKLRERSGPLPIFGVSEKEKDFNLKGWLVNHLLYLTMQTENELASMIPLTPTGAGNYVNMANFQSAVLGNTVKNYKKIFSSIINLVSDDDKAYFDQREGPYVWTQAGPGDNWAEGNKALTYALRSIGITGKGIDPGTATINFVKTQNWR